MNGHRVFKGSKASRFGDISSKKRAETLKSQAPVGLVALGPQDEAAAGHVQTVEKAEVHLLSTRPMPDAISHVFERLYMNYISTHIYIYLVSLDTGNNVTVLILRVILPSVLKFPIRRSFNRSSLVWHLSWSLSSGSSLLSFALAGVRSSSTVWK